MSSIFTAKHLLLDINVKNQTQAFEAIAKLAKQLNITKNPQALVKDLIKREKISTTGMSDEVAIPHAMSADFAKPAIVVARFKNGIEWKAIGGKPVKVAFALLIPKKERGTLHMQYLQNIATALLSKEFNKIILESNNRKKILNTITQAIENKQETKQSNTNTSIGSKGLIVGVSACATGVAHTYMAREALEKSSKEIGYDIWIETQGQTGQEHKLTDAMIKKADYVIIAADINIELDRFIGKKIYSTNTNEAINTPIKALEKTIQQSRANSIGGMNATTFDDPKKSGGFMKHFLNGVSHMIPFIVFSGILYAISHIVIIAIQGNNWDPADHPDSQLAVVSLIADTGFNLFIGVMGGYIALSIAGRSALAPGFIATTIAANPALYINYGVGWMQGADTGIVDPDNLTETIHISGISLGIIAAIGMGFAAGIVVNTISRIRVHKYVKPIVPIIIVPVLATSIIVFPFVFGLSGILGTLMDWIGAGLAIAGTSVYGRVVIGLVLGAMVGFDMGGPINKIAVASATSMIPLDPSLMGAASAAIPVASFGCALASTVVGRKYFTDEEKGLGVTAWFLGFIGISEAAIPFAAKRLKPTVIANVVASAFTGILSALFFVGAHVGMWGGLIIVFTVGVYGGGGSLSHHIPLPFAYDGGGANWQNVLISSAWYIVAIACGTIVHAFLYVALIRMAAGEDIFHKIFSKFKRKKHKDNKTNNHTKKFQYYRSVVDTNWYYRYKIKGERGIFAW